MLVGGFGCCGCCGSGGCMGLSGILGVSSLLFDMYCVLSVRVCGWSITWGGAVLVTTWVAE